MPVTHMDRPTRNERGHVAEQTCAGRGGQVQASCATTAGQSAVRALELPRAAGASDGAGTGRRRPLELAAGGGARVGSARVSNLRRLISARGGGSQRISGQDLSLRLP